MDKIFSTEKTNNPSMLQRLGKKHNTVRIVKALEELVLALDGVNAFDEVLKLIYSKLYFEKYKGKLSGISSFQAENLEFLFNMSKKEWPGMFKSYERIELSHEHLKICSEILHDIILLETDLDIIDVAFEYLLPKASKGSRGQFFTPRHVIKEIIKIIEPKKEEYFLDPACGSGGFLLYAVQRMINNSSLPFGKKIRNQHIANKLFGFDFDGRMAKIAKAILLIYGFNNVNVQKLNSLKPLNEYYFKFDIVCTNPPFGGEIRDRTILNNYELVNEGRQIGRSMLQRHILFLERIISFLKPGGRAAVIIPQGVLNNTNLAYLRNWLYEKARILGVIGLGANTFKPHTNVKTSILFLQKWSGNPIQDYPVFMAVSSKSGKDRSGNFIYKMENGEYIIDCDLPQISENFRKFICQEKLCF